MDRFFSNNLLFPLILNTRLIYSHSSPTHQKVPSSVAKVLHTPLSFPSSELSNWSDCKLNRLAIQGTAFKFLVILQIIRFSVLLSYPQHRLRSVLVLLKTNYTDLAGLITIIMKAGNDQHTGYCVLWRDNTYNQISRQLEQTCMLEEHSHIRAKVMTSILTK